MKLMRVGLGAAVVLGSVSAGAEIHWRVTHNISFKHLRYQPRRTR